MAEQYYCEKCNRTMSADNFYKSNNLEKYPTGKFNICKKCMTMHVDNWNPDTYMWIIQEADVPYVPDEWNKLMAKYAVDRSKTTGTTIIGRYLGKMALKQYKDYRWKHTEFLQDLANKKIYTKQINLDGTASINMYELKEMPIPTAQDAQINSYNYITREEFENALAQLKMSLQPNVNQPKEDNIQLQQHQQTPMFQL